MNNKSWWYPLAKALDFSFHHFYTLSLTFLALSLFKFQQFEQKREIWAWARSWNTNSFTNSHLQTSFLSYFPKLLPLDPDGFVSGLSKAALTVQNMSLNTSPNSMSRCTSTGPAFYVTLLSLPLCVSQEISVHEHVKQSFLKSCCCFAGALVPCCGGIFSRWLMADGGPKTKLRLKWNFHLHLYDGQACCSMVVMWPVLMSWSCWRGEKK